LRKQNWIKIMRSPDRSSIGMTSGYRDRSESPSRSRRDSRRSSGRIYRRDIKNLNDIPDSLICWNLVAAIFQFAQSGALFYFAAEASSEWYLYSNFPSTFGASDEFGTPSPKEIAGYSVTWYSALFVLLSGFYHFIVSFPGFRDTYEYYIERHQNPFRWVEYAFSASLMRIMIAQLSGVTDISTLFSIFCLTATTMLLGGCHESVNAQARADGFKQNWFPFAVAFVPHLASWAIIFCFFFTSVIRGNPPSFVWFIIFIIFALDGTFALLLYLQSAKKGRFEDYIEGEIAFILLSFISKSLLAWLNYFGGLR